MSPEEIVPVRIRELREKHGWSQADLTRVLNQFGAGLDRSQVARVEQGPDKRRIQIDELVLFALALDTSLVSLLFPPGDDDRVALTPDGASMRGSATAKEARAWARGQMPLLPVQDAKFYVLSLPPSELQLAGPVPEPDEEAE
jgi:transcriptional regulator with XRE-family HTH domain